MAKSPKPKDNYFKLTFLIPVVYSVFTAILMVTAAYLGYSTPQSAENEEAVVKIIQYAAYSMAVSPCALMICLLLSRRHIKKNPDSSDFYKRAPFIISVFVMGLQVLYLFTLSL